MKKTLILTAALFIILLLAACTPEKKAEKDAPYVPPAETIYLPTPSPAPTAQAPPTPPPVDDMARETALSGAELYRDIYIPIYEKNPAGVFLTDAETEAILVRLGDSGLSAVDAAGRLTMRNSALAESFVASSSERLTIFELCSDGGYICHDLSLTNGERWVNMSRVAWLDGGEFQLSGDIPTVTFSAKYQVTALQITTEGYLSYNYHMPDNPEGNNHDGHVETIVKLRVR